MGLIDRILGAVFGNGRNVLRDTVEVFRENAEAGAARGVLIQTEAMTQYAAEFAEARQGWFDRFIDGLNRLPRPAMALGTLGLFVSAMVSPLWFSERMQGIALVPEPLWWLLGVIVSFYFGARHQVKAQEFQRSLTHTVRQVPQVIENIETIRSLRDPVQKTTSPAQGDLTAEVSQTETIDAADTRTDVQLEISAIRPDGNAALEDWKASLT